MKAYRILKYGKQAIPALGEASTPECGENDLLIRIKATSMNPLDIKTRNGELKAILPYKTPYIPGNDLAGEVVSIGTGVKTFEVGDRVFAMPPSRRIGTFAEFIAVDSALVAKMPASLSYEEAAVLPLVSLTALQILSATANVKAGAKVLIHGGSGGFGATAVQIAKSLGLFVASTCSSKNVELVKSLGADLVIDYTKEDFQNLCSGYDLVIDTQGGETLINSFKVLAPAGKAISLVGPPDAAFARRVKAGKAVETILGLISFKVRRLARKRGISYEFFYVQPSGKQLEEISRLVESKELKPVIGSSIAFTEIPKLFDAKLAPKNEFGKISISLAKI